MKINKDVIWTLIGMCFVILSFIFLDNGNKQNKWNKVVLVGLFSSFVVKLVYQIIKSKKYENI